jgi:hypothetical protein
VGTPSAAKTGAARGRSRSRRHQARLPPLPPRRRVAVVFLPADEPHHLSSPTPALRPVATKGGTRCSHRTAAPPQLVIPAIEPGWDDFLTCVTALANARAPFAYLA